MTESHRPFSLSSTTGKGLSRAQRKDLFSWRMQHWKVLPKHNNVIFGSRLWRKECGDKIAHFTFKTALIHIIEITTKRPLMRNSGGTKLTIYICPWCDWLHVGHKSKEAKQVIYTHFC